MNEWKCTVKTPSNFLQDVYVEAYTRADAVSAAEHSTGGTCINAVPQFTSSSSQSSSDSPTEINGGLILLGLVALFIFYAWKWILIIGSISFVIFLILIAMHKE
jgi:hypothetical protein